MLFSFWHTKQKLIGGGGVTGEVVWRERGLPLFLWQTWLDDGIGKGRGKWYPSTYLVTLNICDRKKKKIGGDVCREEGGRENTPWLTSQYLKDMVEKRGMGRIKEWYPCTALISFEWSYTTPTLAADVMEVYLLTNLLYLSFKKDADIRWEHSTAIYSSGGADGMRKGCLQWGRGGGRRQYPSTHLITFEWPDGFYHRCWCYVLKEWKLLC